MIFGSHKSEWSDRLARALAQIHCEKPIEVTHGEFVDCGDHPLRFPDPAPRHLEDLLREASALCSPCSARKYVQRFPEDP